MIFSLPMIKIKTAMLTLSSKLKEIKKAPIDRLEELSLFIHSLIIKTKLT